MSYCADHPASLALHRPVSGEAAGGDSRSGHPGFQHPPADAQLHQGQHRRQGASMKMCRQQQQSAAPGYMSGYMLLRHRRVVIAGIKSDEIGVVLTGCQGDGSEGAHRTGFQTGHVGPVPKVTRRHVCSPGELIGLISGELTFSVKLRFNLFKRGHNKHLIAHAFN